MVIADPVKALRCEVARHGTQRAAAQRFGVSQAYLSDLLRGNRSFSDDMLRMLGLRRVVVKLPKEKK